MAFEEKGWSLQQMKLVYIWSVLVVITLLGSSRTSTAWSYRAPVQFLTRLRVLPPSSTSRMATNRDVVMSSKQQQTSTTRRRIQSSNAWLTKSRKCSLFGIENDFFPELSQEEPVKKHRGRLKGWNVTLGAVVIPPEDPIADNSTLIKSRGGKRIPVELPSPEQNLLDIKAALEDLDAVEDDVFQRMLTLEEDSRKSGDGEKTKRTRGRAPKEKGTRIKKKSKIVESKPRKVTNRAKYAEEDTAMDASEEDETVVFDDVVGKEEDEVVVPEKFMKKELVAAKSIDESLLDLPYYLQKDQVFDKLPPVESIAKEIAAMLPDYAFNVKMLFKASLMGDELVVTTDPAMRDKLVQRLWIEKFGVLQEEEEDMDEEEAWEMKNDPDMKYLSFLPKENTTQIVSVVQRTGANSSCEAYVEYIYAHICNATNNDPRIQYIIEVIEDLDNEFLEETESDIFQMFTVGRNCYHLIDGTKMKEVWGCMMPHIIFGEKNLQAIVRQVQQAVEEDFMEAVVISPRMLTIRLAGGSREMKSAFNTEKIESEFSTVSVR